VTAPHPPTPTPPDPERDRARLGPDQVRGAVEAYALEGVRTIREFRRGNPDAPKALIEARSGRYLLKRRAAGFESYARIQGEHRAQALLQCAGLPVPAPLSTRNGETILVLDGAIFELFPFVEGDAWTPSPESAGAAGAVLARLHAVLARFPGEGLPAFNAESDAVERAFDQLAGPGPASRSALERLSHDWQLARARAAPERPAPIHGDFHPGNTVWRGRALAAVLDFERMRTAPPLDEAAIASLHFALDRPGSDPGAWPDAPDIGRMSAFWTGYARVAPDRATLDALPWRMIAGLVGEALPRACTPTGFGVHAPERILPYLARTTGWLADHAEGIAEVIARAFGPGD
jgi:Ser/Thr protein kinase RdoA (MazF antagonist)